MKIGQKFAPSEVDFWLDTDRYVDYIDNISIGPNKPILRFNTNLIRLASVRKAISNFVRILTRKSIPVYFNDVDITASKSNVVYISADINAKDDFDVAVGLALHEGSHILLSDFDVVSLMWANLPSKLLKLSDEKNIRRASIERFIHKMWNIIEDRYVDNYIFNTAPGYRGYYAALYNRFCHCSKIDEYLQSDEYRWPSLESYLFRISNLTNVNTDLTALPRLDEIADIIDLSNINRLSSTMKRIDVAFEVVEIVLDCLDKDVAKPASKVVSISIITPDDVFGKLEDADENDTDDAGTKIIKEISDVIGNRDLHPEKMQENTDVVSKISENLTPELENDHKEISQLQHKFLTGQIPKKLVTPTQKELLDLIDQHGIILVPVGMGLLPGDYKNLKIDCIVVQKMTKELILKGREVFPLSSVMKIGEEIPEPSVEMSDAVKRGILLGTKLGKKLQVRSEINLNKSLRKKHGKINKRQLHEAAFDADDLFYKINIENYNKLTLHISVDASSSMIGEKWYKTMTTAVAICKATSMIDNIHVTVSFRSTQTDSIQSLPYVILAYDSKIDKFSKVKNLFPYLEPNGCTPEGLAFEAIMGLFENITPDETDRYFLNLSDGEPYYAIHFKDIGVNISYFGDVGVSHTREQVNKIRKKDVQILSYFIETPNQSVLKDDFYKMYGKNAKFIRINEIVDLSKTLNELFLKRFTEKNT